MKKNRIILLIIVILLLIITIVLIISNTKDTLSNKENQFAVEDTTGITKIFIADKNNNFVTLKKVDNTASWTVNDTFSAIKENVFTLLKTIMEVEVKIPVPKNGADHIMRMLATTSTKVEIYKQAYRINIFGIRWFPYEKNVKTYYVGVPTQDNMGTYMVMEGSDTPYIVYIEGFRGFLSSRYSPFVKDWRDHTIFRMKYKQIKSVEVIMHEKPEESFIAEKTGIRDFIVQSGDKSKKINYDTLKIMDLFSSFEDIRFESFLNDLDELTKDSIKNSPPYITINVVDTTGKVTKVETRLMKAPPSQIDQLGNEVLWDRDRLYAYINNGKDLVVVQFFVFGRLFKPLSFYVYGYKESYNPYQDFKIIQ